MCSSSTSCSYLNVHVERKPTTLKDFLHENSNSYSSSGFKSSNPNSTTTKLQRSTSKAASKTLLVFHSIMNAVKKVQFTAVKTPSFLPRSLSRRLSKRSSSSSWSRKQTSDLQTQVQTQVQVSVKVKDILPWTSFRDTKLPQCPPWDDRASSPHHCTTTTTTTTTTCSNSSNGSSWCESDFTVEFLPSPCDGENEMGKNYSPCVGRGSRCIELDSKVEVLSCDEDEQHSPVSVLDYQFGEDDCVDQSLVIVEGLYYEEEADEREIEERAMEMLNYMKETSLTTYYEDNMEDRLLLDLFKEKMESAQRNDRTQDGFDWKNINKAKDWNSGENVVPFEWGVEHKKEGIVRDMHKGGKWINKFEDEQEELAMEIESAVLEYLVEEILVDLLLT